MGPPVRWPGGQGSREQGTAFLLRAGSTGRKSGRDYSNKRRSQGASNSTFGGTPLARFSSCFRQIRCRRRQLSSALDRSPAGEPSSSSAIGGEAAAGGGGVSSAAGPGAAASTGVAGGTCAAAGGSSAGGGSGGGGAVASGASGSGAACAGGASSGTSTTRIGVSVSGAVVPW